MLPFVTQSMFQCHMPEAKPYLNSQISINIFPLVWYGMVWYGMVWYGIVWYGMVWYGMVTLFSHNALIRIKYIHI